MRLFLTTLFFIVSLQAHNQNLFHNTLLSKVNHLRDSLSLPLLELDTLLNEASEDHVYYISLKNNLTHFQTVFSKETPAERVKFYKGNRTYVGENIAYIDALNEDKTKRRIEELAVKFYESWLNSPPHFENMINPFFTKMGVAYKTKNGKVYSAQVFSSNEIELPKQFQNNELSWGIRPSESSCKTKASTYDNLFFANSVAVEGNSIYLYYHSIDYFKRVISNENDGIAVDIVLREQLPCSKENQFNISEVYDGEMQRPVYKNDLYRNNLATNPKKIKVKVGEVPSYLSNQQWEANIITFKNNKLCDYSYPVEIPSSIYSPLYIQPYADEHDVEQDVAFQEREIRIQDTLHIPLSYNRSKKVFNQLSYEDYMKFMSVENYFNHVTIDCFTSVEGAIWYNEQLLEERKKAALDLFNFKLLKEEGKLSLNTAENWKLMNKQIDELNIKQLKNKSQQEIKRHFKLNKSEFYDSLLYEQRKTHVHAFIDTTISIRATYDYLFGLSYDSTLPISILPWNKLLRENHIEKRGWLSPFFINELKKELDVKTNLLGAVYNNHSYIDSITAYELFSNIDYNNHKQLFNYGNLLTKYWFSNYANTFETQNVHKTINPEQLRAYINQIDTTIIKNIDLSYLKVNIFLTGIHYYTAHNQWQYVDDYFKEIVKLVKTTEFKPNDALGLALFCNHFFKFNYAIEILHPFFEQNNLPEDGYFFLAKTATLIRGDIDREEYLAYMNKAKQENLEKYCQWLDNSFQVQRDEHIKQDFCTSCN